MNSFILLNLLTTSLEVFPLSLNIPLNMEEQTQSIYEVIGAPTRIPIINPMNNGTANEL